MKNKISSHIALYSLLLMAFAVPVSHAQVADLLSHPYNGTDDLGFSLIFPNDWEDYNIVEVELEWGNNATVPGVDIGKMNELPALTISRYTTNEWNDLMLLDGPGPTMLGSGNGFVLGYSINQELFNDEWQWVLDHVSIHKNNLSDIGAHENRVAIQYLADNNVISGYPDGTFKPEQNINRAELMKIITEASGKVVNSSQYNNCFPDVTDEWFAAYVCYAKEQNWIQGYPDGMFKPANDINKVEALKMIINSQGISIPGAVNETTFDDVDNSAWYAPFVKAAADNQILVQTNGEYGVGELITRGEVSENIYRALLIAALASSGEIDTGTNHEPLNPEDVIASIDGYTVFESQTYNFSIEYPDQWFYEGLNADPFSGVRIYNFGPDIDEDGEPVVVVEISGSETPDGAIIDMNDKELVLIEDDTEVNVYYTGDVTGRRFRVHGASDYEEIMLNMASSIEDKEATQQSGY